MNTRPNRKPDAVKDAQVRASTGITGLDLILGGGLPTKHLYLVEGNPGSGKTTLGIQFLREGVIRGESGLYVTLSETATELATVAASHGWSLEGMEIFELVNEDSLSLEAEQSILHPAEVELGETTRGVMAAVEKLKPSRVVFDSLSEMRMLAQDPLRYRRQILALKHFFTARGCTVLMLDDKTGGLGDLQLHSIAHGVVSLEQTRNEYGPERRQIRVVKLRGVKFRGGEHDFLLDTGGIEVYPRLVAAEHHANFEADVVGSGNAELDKILGGGFARGSNTLFSGPSGVGKTTTALASVLAALERGEKAAYYLFDEGLGTLLLRARALGINIEGYLESGDLEIFALDPAEISPGQFAHMVRASVEIGGARTVVIDSLNAYLQGMPGEKFLQLQMHELLTYLNQKGVVTMLILGQHGIVGEIRSDVDLSYLSDAILLFRYFESQGSVLKAVSVVKSRTNQHELTIREFRLGKKGVEVGPVLSDFQGVLGGIPTYSGKIPLLSEQSAPAQS
ncbi:MAG: circadian clock protein KaiC [Comamonadaceae bacterium]|nr:MAG: circadian clock protein KaiC [Comamonadaceae bacterium]